jgi:hypothetical protein
MILPDTDEQKEYLKTYARYGFNSKAWGRMIFISILDFHFGRAGWIRCNIPTLLYKNRLAALPVPRAFGRNTVG